MNMNLSMLSKAALCAVCFTSFNCLAMSFDKSELLGAIHRMTSEKTMIASVMDEPESEASSPGSEAAVLIVPAGSATSTVKVDEIAETERVPSNALIQESAVATPMSSQDTLNYLAKRKDEQAAPSSAGSDALVRAVAAVEALLK